MPKLLLGLSFVAGCSDYEFSTSPDPVADNDDHGPSHAGPSDDGTTTGQPQDTGNPGETTGGDTTDTNDTTTDTNTDTGNLPEDTGTPHDACYEPEDGYDQNPAARIIVTDASVPITVTYLGSDSDYDDELWLDSPGSQLLAQPWADAVGTVRTLGPFPVDTELLFAIQVLDTGDHWQSGPQGRNSDGVIHGAATYEGGCSWIIGFEDLNGGGDLDYNDIIMRVQGMLRQDQ